MIPIAASHSHGTSSAARRKRRTKSATSEPLVLGKTLHALTGWKFTGEATPAALTVATQEENMDEVTCSTTSLITDTPLAKDEQLQKCIADDFRPDSSPPDEFLPMSGDQESVEYIEMSDTVDQSTQSLEKRDNPSIVCLDPSTGSVDASQLTLESLEDPTKSALDRFKF